VGCKNRNGGNREGNERSSSNRVGRRDGIDRGTKEKGGGKEEGSSLQHRVGKFAKRAMKGTQVSRGGIREGGKLWKGGQKKVRKESCE